MDTTPEESALLSHHYHLCEVIEKGPLSVIHRAVHRTTQKQYAIKTIDLKRYERNTGLGRQEVDAELEMCASLKHPFVCELRDVIVGDHSVHLVFEYLEGADICFEIVKRASNGFVYSEAVISHYIRQLMLALDYLHGHGVVHRDIRPHNIVLANKDNSAPLKLCGFGVAVKLPYKEAKFYGGRVGVAQFMAPEVVTAKEYGTAADLWSAGVILHLLLSGRLPFMGSSKQNYECIKEGRYSLSGSCWAQISDSAKDLLIRCLTVDDDKRITAIEALNHEWIKDREHFAPRRHMQDAVENIRKYNHRRKLKSTILAAVNTDKWSSLRHSTYLNGDSPGGDSCHPDGCTRATSVAIPDDLAGAHKILASLDTIASLSDPPLPGTPNILVGTAITDSAFTNLLQVSL